MNDQFWYFGTTPFTAYWPWAAHDIYAGGVYSLARWEGTGFRSLYFGKAGSFRDRLNGHEHWDEALGWGMDAVLIHFEQTPYLRAILEEHLIKAYPTPINDRLNRSRELAAAVAWPPRGALEQVLDLPRRRTALEEYLQPNPFL